MTNDRFQPRSFEVTFWLLCLFPVGLVALWRSGWPQRLKIGLTCLIVVGTIILTTAQTISTTQDAIKIAAAPHMTDEALAAAYQNNRQAAQKQFDHKMIVVTGIVGGMDEGLFGDGCIHMREDIVCDVGGHFGNAQLGQETTIVGICESMDSSGTPNITDCRILKP